MNNRIIKCKNCRTLFESNGVDICFECAEELNKIFVKIQDYLYEHENASVIEISKALDINDKIILDFLRDGSLVVNNDILICGSCNKPIQSGRYCNNCKIKLNKIFKNSISSQKLVKKEKQTTKNAKMHINLDKKG